MYKKIKNGSFMNWIWFIIATLPFILLIIYSISFFNREENNYIYQTQYETIKRINLNNEQSFINPKTYDINIYDFNNETMLQHDNNKYNTNGIQDIIISKDTDYDKPLNDYIYLTFLDNYESFNINILLIDLNQDAIDLNIITINQYDILCFNGEQLNAIYIVFQNNIQHNFLIGKYENHISLNPIKSNCIGEKGYITINSLTYDNNNVELPTNILYENDYIDFENGIYTLNNIEHQFTNNIKFIELNKTFNYTIEQYQYKASSDGTIPKTYDYYNNGDLTINRINNIALSNNHITVNVSNNTSLNIESEIITTNITNYEDYLQSINNTLKTNGFISNAFLNLSQFFGVSNVYYSLACYYIEYLLVIVLLHLAFDLLYIVPNICHKFMEKIGGERD